MVTKREIQEMLRSFGIRPDDTVTIHAALRKVGPIENGADGLIDAIKEYLSDGLFLVPTHTWANVNRKEPFFDVRKTAPCIGTLATVAAFRKDAVRSLHPTHSVAAFGKEAEEYVKGEEHSATPAPPTGCMGRLYERHAKVILLGVGQERDTYLHVVDERLDLPNRLHPEPYVITIRDGNGNELSSPPFAPHYTPGPTPIYVSDYFPNYDEAFDRAGATQYGALGNAKVCCADVRIMDDTVRALYSVSDHDLTISHDPIPESYLRAIGL